MEERHQPSANHHRSSVEDRKPNPSKRRSSLRSSAATSPNAWPARQNRKTRWLRQGRKRIAASELRGTADAGWERTPVARAGQAPRWQERQYQDYGDQRQGGERPAPHPMVWRPASHLALSPALKTAATDNHECPSQLGSSEASAGAVAVRGGRLQSRDGENLLFAQRVLFQ